MEKAPFKFFILTNQFKVLCSKFKAHMDGSAGTNVSSALFRLELGTYNLELKRQ